jgi:hypothetical protein
MKVLAWTPIMMRTITMVTIYHHVTLHIISYHGMLVWFNINVCIFDYNQIIASSSPRANSNTGTTPSPAALRIDNSPRIQPVPSPLTRTGTSTTTTAVAGGTSLFDAILNEDQDPEFLPIFDDDDEDQSGAAQPLVSTPANASSSSSGGGSSKPSGDKDTTSDRCRDIPS